MLTQICPCVFVKHVCVRGLRSESELPSSYSSSFSSWCFPPHSQPSESGCVVYDSLSALITDQRSQSELINLRTFWSRLKLTHRPAASKWTYQMYAKKKLKNMCTHAMIIRKINAIWMWVRVIRSCHRRSADRILSDPFRQMTVGEELSSSFNFGKHLSFGLFIYVVFFYNIATVQLKVPCGIFDN